MTPVHFWCPPGLQWDPRWDPDEEPDRYADGFGHNVLELYVRMLKLGCDVRLGPHPRAGSRVVVFLPSLLERREQWRLAAALGRQRQVELVSIRSDFVTSYQLPVRPSVEVMPNQASIVTRGQVWLPPLPQRGLIPRDARRGNALRTVGFKGYPENLPEAVKNGSWEQQLATDGLSWQPDLRDPSTGVNAWHDFSSLDVALCLRTDGPSPGLLRKPATKLINAWCAGSIPIVAREPSYLELGTHREDVMVVDSVDHALRTLKELHRDPSLVERLRAGGAARAADFTVGAVLSRWVELLSAPIAPARIRSVRTGIAVSRVGLRLGWDALHGDRRSAIWSPS